MYVNKCIHVYIRMYKHMSMSVSMSMSMYVYVYIYICICIYLYMYRTNIFRPAFISVATQVIALTMEGQCRLQVEAWPVWGFT